MNHENNKKQQEPLPFVMDHLPAAFHEKAELELHETVKRRVECLKEIRGKIKAEKALGDIEFHNDFLQQFLRHSKYDVEKALNRLENFISRKRNHHRLMNKITDDIADEMFEKVKSADVFKWLPRRTPDGCAIVILKFGNCRPNNILLNDFMSCILVTLQQCLRDPMTQINGFVSIFDWKNTSLRELRQFTPTFIYEAATLFLDQVPARYKEIHLINHPPAVKVVWAILKPLLSKKIKKRFIFHSDPKALLECIPLCVIPAEYGGCLNEEFYESTMSSWLTKVFEQQKHYPLGGQCNYY